MRPSASWDLFREPGRRRRLALRGQQGSVRYSAVRTLSGRRRNDTTPGTEVPGRRSFGSLARSCSVKAPVDPAGVPCGQRGLRTAVSVCIHDMSAASEAQTVSRGLKLIWRPMHDCFRSDPPQGQSVKLDPAASLLTAAQISLADSTCKCATRAFAAAAFAFPEVACPTRPVTAQSRGMILPASLAAE